MKFRLLRADEIDCRISTCNSYGVGLLLYKDARCDQNILDETVGAKNWQRHHSRDNANCIVSIWDEEKKQWIEKEDTGTESFTEKEKGLASDSFKRACFNWGIGRELYTAPNMFVFAKDLKTLEEVQQGNFKKWTCKDSFKVIDIQYIDEKIVYVKVLNLKKNTEIEFGTPANELLENNKIENSVIDTTKINALIARCENENVNLDYICKLCKVNKIDELTEKNFADIHQHWEGIKEGKF
jgi:hypothetical protein